MDYCIAKNFRLEVSKTEKEQYMWLSRKRCGILQHTSQRHVYVMLIIVYACPSSL